MVWLKEQPDNSIDHIITDPPYLIDFMGKGWDSKDNIAGNPEFWKECLRVVKPGGYCLSFGHSRTHHRIMIALEDAGWELRDCLMWLYGSGFPKSQDLGKRAGEEWKGWGNALKPAYEPIIMARKPFKGSLTNNVLEFGTGGLNIDACRVGSEVMPAIETKTETTEIGWEKKGYTTPEKTGRFPANIMLSHSTGCSEKVYRKQQNKVELYDCEDDCPVKLLDDQSGVLRSGYVAPHHKTKDSSWFGASGKFAGNSIQKNDLVGGASRFFQTWECEDDCPVKLLDEQAPKVGNAYKATRKKKTTGGSGNSWTNAGKEEGEENGIYDGLAGASRFFYCAKVSKKERGKDNNHPTIKPVALMKWLVKLVSKEGQTILDPFAGSGSTGIAVELLGREFVGLELDPDYCDIAERRIEAWLEKEKT